MPDIPCISGRTGNLAGGLTVRRLLPAAMQRSIGPFVFFDHFGPVELPAEAGSDIGPHPHIGLATVSYLFEGHLLHRDSLGNKQTISPGAVNWMTAGRGIVHSERTIDVERSKTRRLHGLQLWVALPPEQEQCDPSFKHIAASAIPEQCQHAGVKVRVLVGQAFGLCSPVRTASPTLYLDVYLPAGAQWQLPRLADEMALYSPEHGVEINGQAIPPQQMAVLPTNTVTRTRSGEHDSRFVVIGGAALVKPVRMWWNFVSTEQQRIADAAQHWETGGFDPIAGETERIPAPKLPSLSCRS